jgi:hypothetical protein
MIKDGASRTAFLSLRERERDATVGDLSASMANEDEATSPRKR